MNNMTSGTFARDSSTNWGMPIKLRCGLSPLHTAELISHLELDSESNRFANILNKLEYHPSDIFFTYIPKVANEGDTSTLEI
jgi:hypothetical protein